MRIDLNELAIDGIEVVKRPNEAPYWIVTDPKKIEAYKVNGAPVYYFPRVSQIIHDGSGLKFDQLTILEASLKGSVHTAYPVRALQLDERITQLQSGGFAIVRDETSTLDEINDVATELREQRKILNAIAEKVGATV